MSIQNTGLGHGDAIVVSPKRAQAMLDIGQTRLYELFAEGKSRASKMENQEENPSVINLLIHPRAYG